jgi:3-hydroxymyristoyl/3-hydroxydecanoyl-(acyl carrier protein) dehydratase
MVRPGDRLDIQVKLSDRVQDAFFLRGTVRVDGRVCASLDFVTTAVPSPVSEE